MVKKVTGIDTAKLPKMSGAEQQETLLAIKNGRTDLREKFLLANVRLVLSAVQRFDNTRESPDDLFQVGMIGLMKALDNFDVTLNVRFSTYAIPMVIGEIRRYIREGSAFKVGRNVRDIAYRAVKARESLEARGVREASLSEIADELGVPYREVVGALDAIAEPQSIYEQAYGSDEEGAEIIDLVKDPRADSDYADRIVLRDGIEALPEREKRVIIMRYYHGRTQTEIADELEMSQAQVSRLEKSAVARLRETFSF